MSIQNTHNQKVENERQDLTVERAHPKRTERLQSEAASVTTSRSPQL